MSAFGDTLREFATVRTLLIVVASAVVAGMVGWWIGSVSDDASPVATTVVSLLAGYAIGYIGITSHRGRR